MCVCVCVCVCMCVCVYIYIYIYGAKHGGFVKGGEYTDLADQLQTSQILCAMETLIVLLGRSVS